MNNSTVILIIGILIIIALLIAIPCNENFIGYEYPYFTNANLSMLNDSNVNCDKFPDAPACKPTPNIPPTPTDLNTCMPDDGRWSIPGKYGERSTLNTPCCQAPDYKLAKNYKTCDDVLNPNDPIDKCIINCCQNADAEANNYDSSWYPMAKCACSLWCNNQKVPHFKKYGTAVHYITGDLAEAQTSDSGDFIGGTGYDFSGQ